MAEHIALQYGIKYNPAKYGSRDGRRWPRSRQGNSEAARPLAAGDEAVAIKEGRP
jgi:hypothetical protein